MDKFTKEGELLRVGNEDEDAQDAEGSHADGVIHEGDGGETRQDGQRPKRGLRGFGLGADCGEGQREGERVQGDAGDHRLVFDALHPPEKARVDEEEQGHGEVGGAFSAPQKMKEPKGGVCANQSPEVDSEVIRKGMRPKQPIINAEENSARGAVRTEHDLEDGRSRDIAVVGVVPVVTVVRELVDAQQVDQRRDHGEGGEFESRGAFGFEFGEGGHEVVVKRDELQVTAEER